MCLVWAPHLENYYLSNCYIGTVSSTGQASSIISSYGKNVLPSSSAVD